MSSEYLTICSTELLELRFQKIKRHFVFAETCLVGVDTSKAKEQREHYRQQASRHFAQAQVLIEACAMTKAETVIHIKTKMMIADFLAGFCQHDGVTLGDGATLLLRSVCIDLASLSDEKPRS